MLMMMTTMFKRMVVALLGEKILSKVIFSLLGELTKHTENKLDDEILADWKEQYYGSKVQAK